jgi:hypothetical protein
MANLEGPFWQLSLNEAGDFFAGAVGPIALLWLVRGYSQQNAAINIQSGELRAAVHQYEAQVTATNRLVDHELRQSRIEYYRLVSEASNYIRSCKLLLHGEREKRKTVPIAHLNSDDRSFRGNLAALNLLKNPYDSLASELFLRPSIFRDAPTVKQYRRTLSDNLSVLEKRQGEFEGELENVAKTNIIELENKFRKMVMHIVDAQNLIDRVELLIKLEEKNQKNN